MNILEENKVLKWIPIILSLFIGLYAVCHIPIDLDEPFSIFHAQMEPSDILNSLLGYNNPPLYEILLHYWIKIFGISQISVRMPSLLFSTLTVYVVYSITRRISSSKAALIAAFLMCTSSYFTYLTHEARVYSLLLLLSSLSILLTLKISSTGIVRYSTLFLLFVDSVLMIYAHYFGVFLVGLHAVFLIFYFRKDHQSLRRLALFYLSILLTYLPYLSEIVRRFTESSAKGTWVKATENLGNLHDLVFWLSNYNKYTFLFVILLLYTSVWLTIRKSQLPRRLKGISLYIVIPGFLLVAYSIYFNIPFIWRLTESNYFTSIFVLTIAIYYFLLTINTKRILFKKNFIVGMFLFPMLIFLSISFVIPVWIDRYLIFVATPFFVVISSAIDTVLPKKRFFLLSSLALFPFIITFRANYSEHNKIDEAMNYVTSIYSPDTSILINPTEYNLTFCYYFDKDIFSDYRHINQRLESKSIFSVRSTEEYIQLEQNLNERIIYIDGFSKFSSPGNQVLERLKTKFRQVSFRTFEKGIIVAEFNQELKN